MAKRTRKGSPVDIEKGDQLSLFERPHFADDDDAQHELEVAQARDYYIVQSNDMAQKQRFLKDKNAGKALTVPEHKILAYLLSQIKPDAKHLEPILLDIRTFCEVVGLATGPTDNNYGFVRASVQKLADRSMWLYDETTKSETIVRYIERATLYHRSGKILIEWDPVMERYLINLAGNYFQYSFHNILGLKYKYSITLYMLLKSFYYKYPSIRFSLDDFKTRIDATNYDNIAHLKARVIEPALEEINNYTDLKVEVVYEKTGKSITHIIFKMHDLERDRSPEGIAEHHRRYHNTELSLEDK